MVNIVNLTVVVVHQYKITNIHISLWLPIDRCDIFFTLVLSKGKDVSFVSFEVIVVVCQCVRPDRVVTTLTFSTMSLVFPLNTISESLTIRVLFTVDPPSL